MLRVAVLLLLASFHTSRADGCGGELTNSSGQITSPNYPNEYPPNSRCDYTIRTEPGTVITLQFHNFTLETSDYLEIRDTSGGIGVSRVWHFWGKSLPPEILSSGNSLSLKFRSNSRDQFSGFNATYSTTCCGGELTSSSGQITSPGYPNEYPRSITCEYIIRTEPGTVVTLQFHNFTLDSKLADSIEIRDTSDGIGVSKVWTFRGKSLPPEFRSSGNSLSLKFRSDSSDQFSGFNATYSTTCCGGELTNSSRQITSPNYPNNYPPNSECEYAIRTEPGTVITLQFHNFTLETSWGDWLQIRDTSDGIGVSKVWTFWGKSLPPEFRSSGNSLSLKFWSDSSNQFSGFNATYSTTYVGGQLTSSSGQITSPGYPNKYPPKSECQYIITTEPETVVTLKFHNFTLETHENCHRDYLTIYDGASSSFAALLGRFCGTSLPPEIRSSQNSLYLYFWSNHVNVYNGFNATYSTTWLIPPSVKNVSVTPISSSSVRVHWTSPHPSVNNYTVTVKPVARRHSPPPGCPALPPLPSAFSVTVNGSTTETYIHLPSDLEFRVSVRAAFSDSHSPPSDGVTGYTLPAASEPVRDLSADLRVKADSVTFTWKAPCDTGGVLSHFIVILEPDRKHQNAKNYILNQTVTQPPQESYSIATLMSHLTAECMYTVKILPVSLTGLYGANQTTSFQNPARGGAVLVPWVLAGVATAGLMFFFVKWIVDRRRMKTNRCNNRQAERPTDLAMDDLPCD